MSRIGFGIALHGRYCLRSERVETGGVGEELTSLPCHRPKRRPHNSMDGSLSGLVSMVQDNRVVLGLVTIWSRSTSGGVFLNLMDRSMRAYADQNSDPRKEKSPGPSKRLAHVESMSNRLP